MWKDFFYFTKKERQGILILITLICGIFIGKFVFSDNKSDLSDNIPEKEIIAERDVFPDSNEHTIKLSHLYSFDPNTIDSTELLAFGLSSKIVRNIIEYRNKGGKFKRPTDIRKIYNLRDEDADRLEPYIKIQDKPFKKKDKREKSFSSDNSEYTDRNKAYLKRKEEFSSDHSNRQEKFKEGIQIDINQADTSEFRKIPGIGKSFASRIVKYRNLLGGFYSVEQIREVYGITEEIFLQISSWMKIDDLSKIKAIDINKASLEKLKAHPYINFYQAKVIIELRKKRGRLDNISELSLLEEFSDQDIEKLKNYFSFDK